MTVSAQVFILTSHVVLLQAMQVFPELLQADRCALLLIQPETQDVWLAAGTGLKARQITVDAKTATVDAYGLKGCIIRRDNLQACGVHPIGRGDAGLIQSFAMGWVLAGAEPSPAVT